MSVLINFYLIYIKKKKKRKETVYEIENVIGVSWTNANAGHENMLKSADSVHFFNRRFEQTFHGYSDESSAKELFREKQTEREKERESNTQGGGDRTILGQISNQHQP